MLSEDFLKLVMGYENRLRGPRGQRRRVGSEIRHLLGNANYMAQLPPFGRMYLLALDALSQVPRQRNRVIDWQKAERTYTFACEECDRKQSKLSGQLVELFQGTIAVNRAVCLLAINSDQLDVIRKLLGVAAYNLGEPVQPLVKSLLGEVCLRQGDFVEAAAYLINARDNLTPYERRRMGITSRLLLELAERHPLSPIVYEETTAILRGSVAWHQRQLQAVGLRRPASTDHHDLLRLPFHWV